MSSFKSSRNIQKKECGPFRPLDHNFYVAKHVYYKYDLLFKLRINDTFSTH